MWLKKYAAAASTFMRFFPKIKARYDYGFLIFILTFSFISISGYRADEIIDLAHKRLSTIVIGGSVSLLTNTLIFPVWAGEELHNSVATNMEKLGHFLEGIYTCKYVTMSHLAYILLRKVLLHASGTEHHKELWELWFRPTFEFY